MISRASIHLLLVMSLLTAAVANAETRYELLLDFPVIDAPYNWSDGYTAPSMQQSLHVTKNFYQYAHARIAEEADPRKYKFYIAAFDVLSFWAPFGNAWLHEEWHRAVMGHYGIDSYNEIYDFPLFEETIAVSHVDDVDLIRLKADHPADQVRLSSAGLEAQYELNQVIEKDRFYNQIKTWDDIVLWLNTLNSIAYMHTCATPESVDITAALLQQEGTDINERDFTGLDCNAWVYDLFRPDEPYEDRGTHPSGVGVDRYITYDDLTEDEKDFLKYNYYLSYLNLIDPFLLQKNAFRGTNPIDDSPLWWNFTARHHLTSFGFSIDGNLYLKQDEVNVLFILHSYTNYSRHYLGLEAELMRYPVDWFDKSRFVTTRAMLWQQPAEQTFMTTEADTGGLVSFRLDTPYSRTLRPYIELEAKSEGWVAGNVYLQDNISLRIGLTVHRI